MFFSLTELEHHPIHFEVTYAPGEILFSSEFTQDGDLLAKGTTELLRNTQGEIRVRGVLQARLTAPCDRCLEPAAMRVDGPFDLFYRPIPKSAAHGEVHLEEGEIDLSFYEGEGLALEDALREFVLLSVPMRRLCQPDCQGLCPVCGVNRNTTKCDCAAEREDPRWSELRKLS